MAKKVKRYPLPPEFAGCSVMVEPNVFNNILRQCANGVYASGDLFPVERSVFEPPQTTNGIAVIDIAGMISHHPGNSFFSFLMGGTSVEEITEAFRMALNDDSKAIVFMYDSPGGTTAGIFDLADEIYQARGIKPMYAMVNEAAYSAAYALASAADRVFIPRTGGVGSVGVLAVHIDQSEADKQEGIKYSLVVGGEKKADLSSHAPLSDDARERLQAEVDRQYEMFVSLVARNRGISPEAVRSQQAGLFRGEEAVTAGLADRVMSVSRSIQSILTKQSKGGISMKKLTEQIAGLIAAREDLEIGAVMAAMGYFPKPDPAAGIPPDFEAAVSLKVKEAVDAAVVTAKAEGVTEGIVTGEKQGKANLTGYVTEVVETCMLGGTPALIPQALQKETPIEDLKKQIIDEKAAQTNPIRSAVGGVSTGAINALVQDAQKRAGVK